MFTLPVLLPRRSLFHRAALQVVQVLVRAKDSRASLSPQAIRRVLYSCAGLLLLPAIGRWAQGAANNAVYIYIPNTNTSPSAPQIESDLLAAVTTQFKGQLIPSLVAGQYVFTISGEFPSVAESSPILDGTAYNQACAYCFGNGMDEERRQDINTLFALQGQDFSQGVCGGNPIASTGTVTVSTTSALGSCLSVYNTAVDTISLRFFDVFTDTGGKVSGP